MGKDKNKKKVSGAVKTAAKTEKKLEAKRKKEIANLGEDDIENIVASIEREEAKRQAVVEKIVAPPTPRVSATLVPHPTNTSEIILFGGEHHDGKKTFVYNNLYFYNTSKNEWRIIKAPGAPPPRSAHQAVTLSSNKGELWIFGGEFTSVSEMQFYHYKDLWLFNLNDKKWQKVDSSGGPSSRSGHRMISIRRMIGVFGGYHDNGRNYKYYNDLHVFCTDNRVWKKIDTSGIPPSPRSGCLFMPAGPTSLIIYGGYSRVTEGKLDKGITHGDLFRLNIVMDLSNQKSDEDFKSCHITGKWESLKGGVNRPTPPRSSFSTCLAPGNKSYVFGGVLDLEETEEQLNGELFNCLHCLELENGVWRQVNFRTGKSKNSKVSDAPEDMDVDKEEPEDSITVCSDGVFTMTVAGPKSGTATTSEVSSSRSDLKSTDGPSPRMNAMMAVQKSTLYLYGGLVEKGEKQFTLSDMYAIDLHKFDGWKTIIPQSSLPEWLGSESENESGESGSESSGDSDSD